LVQLEALDAAVHLMGPVGKHVLAHLSDAERESIFCFCFSLFVCFFQGCPHQHWVRQVELFAQNKLGDSSSVTMEELKAIEEAFTVLVTENPQVISEDMLRQSMLTFSEVAKHCFTADEVWVCVCVRG
jgi:hypothetical protein